VTIALIKRMSNELLKWDRRATLIHQTESEEQCSHSAPRGTTVCMTTALHYLIQFVSVHLRQSNKKLVIDKNSLNHILHVSGDLQNDLMEAYRYEAEVSLHRRMTSLYSIMAYMRLVNALDTKRTSNS